MEVSDPRFAQIKPWAHPLKVFRTETRSARVTLENGSDYTFRELSDSLEHRWRVGRRNFFAYPDFHGAGSQVHAQSGARQLEPTGKYWTSWRSSHQMQ